MAKMYTLDDKLLIGTPEIRIGDKIFPVDDRKKTAKKILEICDANENTRNLNMIDDIFKLAFSDKDYKEIDKMNISWAANQKLFSLVMSAVTGQDPEEVEERFQGEEK